MYVDCGAVLDAAAPDLKRLYLSDKAAFGRVVASYRQPVIPTGEQTGSEGSAAAPVVEVEVPITAEDEKDEEIIGLRLMLSHVDTDKATQDKAVRRVLAGRREAAI